MKTKILITSLLVLLVILGGLFLVNQSKKTTVAGSSVTQTDNTGSFYTLSDVASHSSKNDCWMVIEGNVYDVTFFIPNHPGGSRILQGCGKDATDLFTGQSPMGKIHSRMARNILKNLQVGQFQTNLIK